MFSAPAAFARSSRSEERRVGKECVDRLAKVSLVERMLVPNQVLSFIQVSSLIDGGANMQELGLKATGPHH